MPIKIEDSERRIVVMKMVMEVMRCFTAAYLGETRFGASCSDLLLCSAIVIGQSEGRPMNASKLAEFAGIPRSSVIRRLAELEKAGLLEKAGNVYRVRPEVPNRPRVKAASVEARKLVIAAAAKLSKMDSSTIAAE